MCNVSQTKEYLESHTSNRFSASLNAEAKRSWHSKTSPPFNIGNTCPVPETEFYNRGNTKQIHSFSFFKCYFHSQVSAFASGSWDIHDESQYGGDDLTSRFYLYTVMALSVSKSHLLECVKRRCICPNENNLCHSCVTVPCSDTRLQNPN